MNYTKPEITIVDDALAAVQSTVKPQLTYDSIPDSTEHSNNSYESDE